MKYHRKPHRGTCRSALALAALLANAHAEEATPSDTAPPASPSATAEEATPPPAGTNLDPLVVSALRVPRPASTVTSAVTVLEPEKLNEEGIVQLRDALNASPGVISTSTDNAATGSVSSLFIRGTSSARTQIVVDGVRLADSNTQLGSILSTGRTYDIGSLEVLRGPQGAIYGGDSIGGVIWLETPRGSGAPSGGATFEAGSFNSYSGYAKFQGQADKLSYYLTGGYEETDNDGPNLHFHQGSVALRAEAAVNDCWTVGTTFRGVDSFYENGGVSDVRLDSGFVTLYGNARISDVWSVRNTIGYRQEAYDSDSSFGNYGTDVEATSIATDHEITLRDDLRLLSGAFYHNSTYENTTGIDQRRERYGAHAVLEWDMLDALTTTGSLRWEDYDAYGDEVTWRLGSIYRFDSTGTQLRAGIGNSFHTPTYLDLYGFGGDPNLQTEEGIGWDVGIAQNICGNHVAEITWFNNRIDDYIVWNGTNTVNLPGTTTTEGLEVGVRGGWCDDRINYRLAWTYLHESVQDQPRNAVTAALNWKPVDKALVGIGATSLSSRSWGGQPLDSYIIARIHGSYQLTDNIKLIARVENVFDESYQTYHQQPSPWDPNPAPIDGSGTAFYAGITFDW